MQVRTVPKLSMPGDSRESDQGSRMVSVPPGYDDAAMDVLTTLAAVLAGVATVVVGVFSLLSIWFDDF